MNGIPVQSNSSGLDKGQIKDGKKQFLDLIELTNETGKKT